MNPQNKRGLPSSPSEWIAHARGDLKLAQIGSNDCDVLNEQVCFHAQQVVEKACKAVLLFKKIDFPFTHDLQELNDILGNYGINLPKEVMDIGQLTPYAVETRYPGCWEDITDGDVNEAVEIAEKVINWAEQYIQ